MSDLETVKLTLQGAILPDPRIKANGTWDEHSSFSQDGPYLDAPRPGNSTNMVLQGSGRLRGPVSKVLRANRGGMPVNNGAAFVIRESTDEGDQYRGWDPYSLHSYHEVWAKGGIGGFYPHYRHFSGVRSQSGNLVTCAGRTTWFTDKPDVVVLSEIDGTLQAPLTLYDENTSTRHLYPSLLELPNGKVLLFHWFYDDSGQWVNLRMWWTEDDGLSWTLGQYACLPEPIDGSKYFPKRISPKYLNGQILLIAHLLSVQDTLIQTYRDFLVQYASTDLGASFSEVVWWEDTTTSASENTDPGQALRGYPVVLVYRGQFLIFFLAAGKPLNQVEGDEPLISLRPFFLRLATAFDTMNTQKVEMVRAQGKYIWGVVEPYLEGETGDTYISDADLAAAIDELGAIYVYGREVYNGQRAVVGRSPDGGSSWEAMGDVISGYRQHVVQVTTGVQYARATKEKIGTGVSHTETSYNTYINYSDPPFNGLEYPDHLPINPNPARTTLTWVAGGRTYSVTATTYNSTDQYVSVSNDKVSYALYVDGNWKGRMTISFVVDYAPDEGTDILLSYDYVVDTAYVLVIDGYYFSVSVPYDKTAVEAANAIRSAINEDPYLKPFVYASQLGPYDYFTLNGKIKGYDFSVFLLGALLTTLGTPTEPIAYKGSWLYLGVGTYPHEMFALHVDSRMLMLHNYLGTFPEEDPQGYGTSMVASWLGGYSSHTMPSRSEAPTESTQLQWEYSWVGFNIPQNMGWEEFASGSETLNDDSTMDVLQRYYGRDLTAGSDQGIYGLLGHGVVKPRAEETNLNKCPFIELTINDGANMYNIGVHVGAAAIRVRDKLTSTNTDVAFDSDGGYVEVLAAARAGVVYVWARVYDGTNDRYFVPVAGPVTVTSLEVVADGSFRWGLVLSNYEVTWIRADYLRLRAGWTVPSKGFKNPEDLFPKSISTDRSSPTVFTDNVALVATSGPAYVGDFWHLKSLYRYGANNLLPNLKPSPRDLWRSTDTNEQRFAWLLSGDAATAAGWTNYAIGVYGAAMNFRTWRLEGLQAGAGAWETIRSFDNAEGFTGLPFVRHGNIIVPADDADTDARNVFEHDLAGRVIDLGGGVLRRLAGNGGGTWVGGGEIQAAALLLEDGDDTEPTSGTCSIWSSVLAAVIFTAVRYAAIRIVIPAQNTRDGYFEAGGLWPGAMAFFGTPYSHGWTIEEDGADVELVTLIDRRELVRERGPGRRRWSLGWTDPVNTREVWGKAPQSRYLTNVAGGKPLGLVCDTPRHLQGLLRRLKGPATPVVAVRSIPIDPEAPASVVVSDADLFMLCRMMGPITRENAWGAEGEAELTRIATFALQEIP